MGWARTVEDCLKLAQDCLEDAKTEADANLREVHQTTAKQLMQFAAALEHEAKVVEIGDSPSANIGRKKPRSDVTN